MLRLALFLTFGGIMWEVGGILVQVGGNNVETGGILLKSGGIITETGGIPPANRRNNPQIWRNPTTKSQLSSLAQVFSFLAMYGSPLEVPLKLPFCMISYLTRHF
jgi:hypothetical protein